LHFRTHDADASFLKNKIKIKKKVIVDICVVVIYLVSRNGKELGFFTFSHEVLLIFQVGVGLT